MPRPPGYRLLSYDRKLGARFVAGTDEAGRGCMAGPLAVAAVCFDTERIDRRRLAQLDDSKRCSPEVREQLFRAILDMARQVVVISVSAAEIDRFGLHRSNLRAMARALDALDPAPDVCLSDGFHVPGCSRPTTRVIGGDGRSAAIAAASIVAKVVRDRHMHRMAERYPQYGFERHVGYITPDHGDAVRAHGVTPLHRRSFQARAYAELEMAT